MKDETVFEIMVVDDHPIVRQGLSALLAQQPDLRVSMEAGSAEDALEMLRKSVPHLALVDLTLSGMSGLELVRRLTSSFPQLPALVISMHDERIYAERALHAGARGYIMKQEASDALVSAVRQILEGKIYISEKEAANLMEKMTPSGQVPHSPLSSLTAAEFDVFQHLAEGLNVNDIAQRIGRSIKTVESHRTNIRRKLGFRNSHELAHFAAQWQVDGSN